MMVRRIAGQDFKIFRVLRIAIFVHPEAADCEQMEAEHIQNTDFYKGCAEQIGTLVEADSRQQAAITGPANG